MPARPFCFRWNKLTCRSRKLCAFGLTSFFLSIFHSRSSKKGGCLFSERQHHCVRQAVLVSTLEDNQLEITCLLFRNMVSGRLEHPWCKFFLLCKLFGRPPTTYLLAVLFAGMVPFYLLEQPIGNLRA